MKQIFKRTLFIFMSILMAQSCHVQASATAAAAAAKVAVDALKATTPLIGEAAKASVPVAASLLRRCCQKVGTAAVTHIIKPAYILGRTTAVATAASATGYCGYLYAEKHGKIPTFAPSNTPTPTTPKLTPSTPPASSGSGFSDGLKWWAPKIIDTEAGKKITEKAQDWGPWISSIVGLDYMKSTSLGKLAIAHPKISKGILAYTAAGYAYIHIVKRIQLNAIHKKFFAGIDAIQNNRPTDPTWIECQTILRTSGRGYPAQPTAQNALDYMKDLKASDIDNEWLDRAFGAHVLYSKVLANDKILWVF